MEIHFSFFGYKEPGIGCIGFLGSANSIITWSSSSVELNKNTKITGDLTVTGTIKSNSSNTITHYCPIETELNIIDDFIIGAPVYITGKVYKYQDGKFVKSIENDSTYCVCSVKTTGTWKEYIGICTRIDKNNNWIAFATHGDYLIRVTDTSCYAFGDDVFIDEGELKTLTGQTAITSKIRRTTVGIITSIINQNMLAVFKQRI